MYGRMAKMGLPSCSRLSKPTRRHWPGAWPGFHRSTVFNSSILIHARGCQDSCVFMARDQAARRYLSHPLPHISHLHLRGVGTMGRAFEPCLRITCSLYLFSETHDADSRQSMPSARYVRDERRKEQNNMHSASPGWRLRRNMTSTTPAHACAAAVAGFILLPGCCIPRHHRNRRQIDAVA